MVGLSGGVDSSVSAYLLKTEGHAVEGLFMKNWVEVDDSGICPVAQDMEDARRVSEKLGIPFYVENFAPEYWDHVFTYFLAEYKAGRTPNPDVLCNKEIKFKMFLDRALALGSDLIATGHYARVVEKDGLFQLYKAADLNKDQSYFLHQLNQYQLSKTVFPLGEIDKPEVRKIAAKVSFDNSAKKDSTGICFIGERKFTEFLQQFIPAQPGLIETADGERIGEHAGLMYYTLGQRKGLQIGGRQNSEEAPWFVVGKKMTENVLVVEQGHDHPLLYSDTLYAQDIHWIAGTTPDLPLMCAAKTRYRQDDQNCSVNRDSNGFYRVEFEQPQRAMTPGQYVVFYNGDLCLGGGVIDHVSNIIYQ